MAINVSGYIGVSAAEQSRTTDFWDSFLGIDCPDGTVVKTGRGANIAANRNGHTRLMLESGAEWLFYVDDDHLFQPDILKRLLAHNVDVVSGLYVHRDAPFLPQMFDVEDEAGRCGHALLSQGERGLVERLSVGAGCLLVRRRVLEALQMPYWTLGQITPDEWGDDLDFCRRVRVAGFSIHVDLEAPIGHKVIGTLWPQRMPDGAWVTALSIGSGAPIAAFPQPSASRIQRPTRPVLVSA
jgi:hypothetical protein